MLVAKPAHRSAAAGIKPPRRRQIIEADPLDRPDPGARGKGDIAPEAIIRRPVKPQPGIGREPAIERSFGLDQRDQAEALARIEQVVGGIEPDLPGQPGDRIGAPFARGDGRGVDAFVAPDQLRAISVGEALLPQRGRIVTDPYRQPPGIGREGIVVRMVQLGREFEAAIALARVRAAESHARALLERAQHAADDQRPFRRRKIAVRPARFGAEAFAGAVACGGGDDPGRTGFLLDRQIDHLGAIGPGQPSAARFDPDAFEQSGGDQCLPKIIDLTAVIKLAGLEPGEHRDVIGAERLVALADDCAIGPARTDRDRQRVIGPAGILIKQHIALTHLAKRIAVFGQRERDLGFLDQHLLGADRIAELQAQVVTDQAGRHGRLGLDGDAGVSEALAQRNLDHREQRLAVRRLGAVEPSRDLRVEPALAGEQFPDQRHILARAAGDLRGIGGLALAPAQRRQVVEAVGEISIGQRVGWVEPGQLDLVSDRHVAGIRRRIDELDLFDLELFERRERLGQLGIADRCVADHLDRLLVGQRRITAGRSLPFLRLGPGLFRGNPPLEIGNRFERPGEFGIVRRIELGDRRVELIVGDDRLDLGQVRPGWRRGNCIRLDGWSERRRRWKCDLAGMDGRGCGDDCGSRSQTQPPLSAQAVPPPHHRSINPVAAGNAAIRCICTTQQCGRSSSSPSMWR